MLCALDPSQPLRQSADRLRQRSVDGESADERREPTERVPPHQTLHDNLGRYLEGRHRLPRV